MDHLYEDGELSLSAKLWFLDVVDGRIALLDEQREDFLYLLNLRRDDQFYASETEAFIIEFPRVQDRFFQMVQEIGEDD